jgi:hypothetical protein
MKVGNYMKKILSLFILFSCGQICADAYENLKVAQAKFHELIYQGGALSGVAGSAPEVAYIAGFFIRQSRYPQTMSQQKFTGL